MGLSLAALPIEIVENISSRASCILGLRAACHELQDKTWHLFRERYFAQRQLWMQRDSLTRLHQISCNARVAPLVRKIVISLHSFHKSLLEEMEAGGRLENGGDAYRRQYEDQEFIMHSGLAVEMLAGILQQLPCCEEINIHWSGEWEYFRPDEHEIQDGDYVWALSNSMRRLQKVVYMPPMITHNEQQSRGHLTAVWCILMGALIKSSSLPLQTLAVTGPGAAFLPEEAFACLSTLQLRELRTSFYSIQNLVLSVESPSPASRSKWDADFSTFLAAFVSLSSLTLEFPPDHQKPLATMLDVLPTFSQLKSLSLVCAHFRPQDLLEFLKRHRHVLKELDLDGVHLVGGSWRDFLVEVGGELALDSLYVRSAQQDGYRVDFGGFWPRSCTSPISGLSLDEWPGRGESGGFVADKRTFAQDLNMAILSIVLSCSSGLGSWQPSHFNTNF